MADSFPNPTGNFVIERNNSSQSELGDLMRRLVNTRWYDAMVIEENVDNVANRYKVNVHAGGIWAKETHKDIIAIVPESQRMLVKGTYCKVVLDGKIAVVMPWYGPLKIILDRGTMPDSVNSAPRRLQGWLGDMVRGVVTTYRTAEYRVSMTYSLTSLWGNASGKKFNTHDNFRWPDLGISFYDDTVLAGFLWPSPTLVEDYDKDVNLLTYVSTGYVIPEGGKLPKATARYQVLTVLDDQLTPTWDYERFI